MLRFQSLASSSAGCSYLLSAEGAKPLLIDAGIRYQDIQHGTNYNVSGLAGCLVSHAHGDHCKAVPNLLSRGVSVYASPEAWEQINIQHHRAHVLLPDTVSSIHGWHVRPFAAVHDAPGTLGFLIGRENERLLYLTDTAYSPYRFEGLTHICIECNHQSAIVRERALAGAIPVAQYARTTGNHMSLERVIDLLRANDLSRVKEIHLLHLSDAHSDEAAMKRAVEEATGCPVYVAAK